MTVYQLKTLHDIHSSYHFFSRENLKFFGERLSEMRVFSQKMNISGKSSWILSTYQRKDPAGPRRHYYAFDAENFSVSYLGTDWSCEK